RVLAADALGKTQNNSAVPPLIGALRDKVWLVRKAAAKALSQLNEIAIDELVRAISIDDDNVRFWIATILGEIGEKAMEPLITMLQSKDREMRYYAVQAMGKIRHEKVVAHLIDSLQDEAWTVRNKVCESLEELGDIAVIPVMKSLMSQNEDRQFWSRKVIEVIGPKEIHQILDVLVNSRDSEMRYFAAFTLSLIGNEKCLPHLISAAMNDPSEWVRKYSITALSRLPDSRSMETLFKLLYDTDDEIAYWTAKSFANLGEMAADKLRELLNDDEPNIRALAIMGLGGIGDEKSLAILIERFKDRNFEAEKCVSILAACGAKALPILVHNLGDARVEVRENCAKAILRIGVVAEEKLAEAMGSDNQERKYWAAKVLRELRKNKEKIGLKPRQRG
ncbi:MAG: HEAT repeat domain-containing protein, partial [Candidatus Wallbacteria bacterium]|nr:HEAT repeat domain-containing protein [Candidatus Wallbacteria bacterium]